MDTINNIKEKIKHAMRTDNFYIILIEVLISFGVFAAFFVVFINYFFIDYETQLLNGFIGDSVGFYKSIITNTTDSSYSDKILNDIILKNEKIEDLKEQSHANESQVKAFNKQYDMKLWKIAGIMILIVFAVILFFMVIGVIKTRDINFKYLAVSFILHTILIIGFELAFVFYVLPLASPVKIYKSIESNLPMNY